MPTIMEEEEPPLDTTADTTLRSVLPPLTTAQGRRAMQQKARQVQVEIIGSKRNNVKVALRKRLQQLIDLQTAIDEIML